MESFVFLLSSKGIFETVEMLPSKVGIWRIECLIGEHLQAGMSTLFLVYNKGEKPCE